ncbi:MAG: acyltransferase [Clostridiales bacterium]|nr:acyltransferase [Clostridiales bacterium]
MAKKQRNTIIELFRFAFTMCVVIAHMCSLYDWTTIRCNGHIAVEFFFVLSGALMARQTMKERQDGRTLPQATWSFMKRKIAGIAPVWYIVLATLTVVYLSSHPQYLTSVSRGLTFLSRLVPTAMFLSGYGLGEIIEIPYSWYIPVMLVSMLAIYPLIHRFGRNFTAVAAPLIVLFFCSWAIVTKGKLFMLKEEYIGFVYPNQLRGFGELCMGCVAWELAEGLRQRFAGRLRMAGRVLATLVSVGTIALPVVWVFIGINGNSHPAILLMFAVGVGVSFSGLDLADKVPDAVNKAFAWLGRISLSVYLGQGLVKTFFNPWMKANGSLWSYCLAALAIGIAVHYAAALALWLFRKLCKGVRRLCVNAE